MSISSVSNNRLYMPSFSAQAETDVRPDLSRQQDPVQLSDKAKQMLSSQIQANDPDAKGEEVGKESVQISSSIGRLSRVSGLQREEVAALYRSIDKLT
ncbi:MAG: hypothetical protein ACTH58_03390 [Marinomonas foliarum]|uniref:hypothetical protein n=1 Tax=Marinomonas foliarum TaxID=491950 RepID=UPI003F99037C